MDVWKKHLAELYKQHSKKQKDTKGEPELFSKVRGQKGVLGVSSTGIALTGRAAREKRKNKDRYKSSGRGRYNFSRLQQINDARAEAARNYRMDDKKHRSEVKTLVDKFFDSIEDKKEEIVDKVSGTKKQQPLDYRSELRFKSPTPFRQKHYYWSSSSDEDYIEVMPAKEDPLGLPRFKNKIEESIYWAKKKLK